MKNKNEINQLLSVSVKARTNNFYNIVLVCLTYWVFVCFGLVIPFWGLFISFSVMSVLAIGQKEIILCAIRGQKFIFEQLFNYLKQFLKVICLKLVVLISIVIWSLCFIVPGVVCGLNNIFVSYVLADNKDMNVIECIEKSKQLIYGRRSTAFIMLISMLLLISIIIGLSCGVVILIAYFTPIILWLKISLVVLMSFTFIFIFVIPYYEIAFASLYCVCSDSVKKTIRQKVVKSSSNNK